MSLLPLATTTWDGREESAMINVISTGNFTMGEKVRQFEQEFASHVGSKFAIMVNSGSSANLLMIAAMMHIKDNPLKYGDEIIVPAVSWPTTYYPVHQHRLKLVFVDVDVRTMNFDIEKLEFAISDKTRAILCVNLLGNPNDFTRIKRMIGSRNIFLLEDNCESLGALYDKKHAGTFGLMGTYSFFFSHHMSTMEGGMIVTDSEELYHILLCIRSHGWTRHLPDPNLVTGKKI